MKKTEVLKIQNYRLQLPYWTLGLRFPLVFSYIFVSFLSNFKQIQLFAYYKTNFFCGRRWKLFPALDRVRVQQKL